MPTMLDEATDVEGACARTFPSITGGRAAEAAPLTMLRATSCPTIFLLINALGK
jgi:hypothetical protein